MERTIVRGKEENTANGPMFVHQKVWISPIAEFTVANLATVHGINENHVISKIVEQWVAENAVDLETRLQFFVDTELPNTFKSKE
jgi:hypothetical protein